MKPLVILGALVLGAPLLNAQTAEKPSTVRIKKTENINGREKITDTTYTVNGPVDIHALEVGSPGGCKHDGKTKKIVIITDKVTGDESTMTMVSEEDAIDKQVERALKAAGVDGKNSDVERIVEMKTEDRNGEKGEHKVTRIVIIKNVTITDPDEADVKRIHKKTGVTDGKLAVDRITFYPNPGNGKFNVSFDLPQKGDAAVTVLNMEGKEIYHETLPGFSGSYNKEIDISENPKGVYFLKVEQGKHAQLKKIVLE